MNLIENRQQPDVMLDIGLPGEGMFMNKILIIAFLSISAVAHADDIVTIPIEGGAESVVLFDFIKSPKSGGVDENGNSILIRTYTTSDQAVRIKCIQNTLSLASSCSVTFRLNAPTNFATDVRIAPTGALVAVLSDNDSFKLNSYLNQPKQYSTQEKVTVEFNGKTFQTPRLSIDCNMLSSSASECKIIAFQ